MFSYLFYIIGICHSERSINIQSCCNLPLKHVMLLAHFFYCFLELHLYRLLAKIAIKSESKVLIDRKCQDKTSLINVNSTNSDALLIRRIHVMITRNAVHRRTPDNGSSASPVQSDSRKGSGGSEACHHTYRSWHEWSGHPMK